MTESMSDKEAMFHPLVFPVYIATKAAEAAVKSITPTTRIFRKGDFLRIPTVGTYRCICADDQVAVFSDPDRIGNINTFTRFQDGSRPSGKIIFDETDMIQMHEDIA